MYRHELSESEHVALLEALVALQGMVILSGYPSPLYDAALPGWKRVERAAMADGALPRVECLWLNPAAARACPQGSLQLDSATPAPSPTPALSAVEGETNP